MRLTLDIRDRFFFLGLLNTKRVLIFKSNVSCYYFFLLNKIALRKITKNAILFESLDRLIGKTVTVYFNKLQTFFKFFTRILFLKGLGFKIKYDDLGRILELKIGLSHMWCVELPIHINFISKKNLLIFRSHDDSSLGSYVSRIKRLCSSNAYNQRGIFFSTDILKLKPITKKK